MRNNGCNRLGNPRVQPIVEPATIAKVLLEMVDGNDTDLARKAVMNLFFNLFFDAFSKFLYVFCVHRASFLQFLFVVQELFVILQQSHKRWQGKNALRA